MLSYKDKLLFLSFQKVITTYISFLENELEIEAQSLSKYRNKIPQSLSVKDKQYAYSVYDNMLSQNKNFKQMLHNINSELLSFYPSDNLSSTKLSDIIIETSIDHLKKVTSLL